MGLWLLPGNRVFDSRFEQERLVTGSSRGLATGIDFGNASGPWAGILNEHLARGELR